MQLKQYAITTYNYLVSQWFFLALGVLVLLAHFFPNVAAEGGHIKAQYSITYGAVAVIFLHSGLTMKTKNLLANLFNWHAHLMILVLSFLVTSSITYGLCVALLNDPHIDHWVLVGLIVTCCCPTTVASNVVMTTQAKGNALLSLCEVVIGNLLGAFITPALVQLFLRGKNFQFGNPVGEGSSISTLYAHVMKQVGLSVFVPLFVGQVVRNIWPKQTDAVFEKVSLLKKVGSVMLLLIMWSSFSTAFKQHSFTSVNHTSVIFLVFFNIGLYLFFTVLCFIAARPRQFIPIKWLWCYDRRDTISIMFCGAAKTAALGVSLISAQYGAHNEHLCVLLVPLVLYQSEQVITASWLVPFFRKWAENEHLDKHVNQPEEAEISAEECGDSSAESNPELRESDKVTAEEVQDRV